MAALLSPSWLGRLTTLLHKEDLMQLTDGKHTVLTLLPNLTNLSPLSVFLLKWKKTLIHHFLSHSLPPSCSHGLWHSLKEPNPAHHISSSFRLYPWSVQMQTVFWVPVPQLYWEAATFQAKEANWITDKTSFNSWKQHKRPSKAWGHGSSPFLSVTSSWTSMWDCEAFYTRQWSLRAWNPPLPWSWTLHPWDLSAINLLFINYLFCIMLLQQLNRQSRCFPELPICTKIEYCTMNVKFCQTCK